MASQRYSPEFKEEAGRQVLQRGYSVAEISQRLDVSSHSLYKRVKAVRPDKSEQHPAELIEVKSEILKLCAQLRRMEEEHDVLKKMRGTLQGTPSKVSVHQRKSTQI